MSRSFMNTIFKFFLWENYGTIVIYIYIYIYIYVHIKMMVLINDSDELYNCPGSFVVEYHYTEFYITLFQHITYLHISPRTNPLSVTAFTMAIQASTSVSEFQRMIFQMDTTSYFLSDILKN